MRIGFLIPAVFALDGPGNGVRVQAAAQAAALAELGHEVVRFDPWAAVAGRFDIVHGVHGAFPLQNFQRLARPVAARVGLAPMLDTNEPIGRYRWAARLGRVVPKIYTVPGELARQAAEADVVVCRSESERLRVVGGLGVAADKVKIVLNGVGPPPVPDPGLARSLVGFDGDFVLHLSAYCQPRKNVVRLIEAVGPTRIPLVIAGSTEDNATFARIKALCQTYQTVRRLGFLPDAARDALLAACRVVTLPSVHEGTGLAALEAAAAGAAVVITERGGARDYFQHHAEYVDPYDTESIRRAVETAFNRPADPALGEHVLQNLTWRRSAEALLRAYESAGVPAKSG